MGRTIIVNGILNLMSKFAKPKADAKAMETSFKNSERASKAAAANMTQAAVGGSKAATSGMSVAQYGATRGSYGASGKQGKDFANMVSGGGGMGGFVAAYATLAANVFAVSAAFQALSNAAKVDQLTQGLELMGARGGIALKQTAMNLRDVTDSAISTADAMRAVAQASSAGLSGEEIEKLGKVARGASLALGRDTAEALDRLTRGAIKLEPELLDELGIMVRLDEAVKDYAAELGVAASSLTLTQRRQAFLNAVLAEGESKFGDINDQIASNPYDKLSASIRDLGTEILRTLNKGFIPIAEALTAVPQLGIVIALGVLKQAFSRLLPTMQKGIDLNNKRVSAISKSLPGLTAQRIEMQNQLAVTVMQNASLSEQNQARKALQRSAIAELRLAYQQATAAKQAQAAENFKLNLKTQGLAYATAEYLTTMKTLSVEQKKTLELAKQLGIEEKLNKSKLAGFFGGVARGATMALGGLMAIATYLMIISALVAAGIALYKKFYPPSEAEVRLKKLNEELKEITDSAAKTRAQLDKMSVGQGLDATINSLLAIKSKLDEIRGTRLEIEFGNNLTEGQEQLRELNRKRNEASSAGQSNIASGGFVRSSPSFDKEFNEFYRSSEGMAVTLEEMGPAIKEMYLGIQAINPELLNNTNELLRQRKTYQEIEASLIDVVDQLEFVRNLNRDLGASVDLIREGMRELNNTDLDNEFTKIAQGIGDIEKRYRQFLIEVDRSGSEFTDTALTLSGLEMPDTVATTFAENLTDAGSESIRTILNTADNLDVEILDRDAINAIVAKIEKIENIRLDTSDEARDTATEVKEAKKEAMSALGALLKTAQGIRGLLGLGTATKEVENLFILAVKREATQKTNLSIYKEQNNQLKLQLQTSQKILDIENKLVKVTGPFASATKAIFELSKKTSQIQLGVLQTENKLAAIQDKKVLLNAQLAAEQSKSAEDQNQHLIEYLQAQISANEDLGQEQRKSAKQELQSQLDILGAEQQAVQVQQDAIKLALTEGDILKDNQQVTKAMLMAEQMRLDEQTKVISSLKEQLRIRREIEDINRSSARAGREAEAERLGLKIPSQIAQAEDSATRLKRLKEDRDGINGQQSLLEMERDAAIKKIELEKLALEIQMQASKTALQASNLELEIAAKKAEELDLTDQANKARDIIAANDTTIGAITENESLIDSFYEGTIERENALFDARKSKLDAQIEAEEAAGDRIATTIEQRFQEAMTRLGMGGRMDMASFGLTGGARDFFQTEAGGILTNTDLTDEEKAAQIDQVKEMASQLETAQMAAEGFGAIMNTVQSSIEGAFMSIIDGSKEAGEAFADMAKAILKQIIQMIIKMLVFKAIEAGLNFVSPGAGTLLVGGLKGTGGIMQANPMASGGVMQAQAYASGGVLSRRDRNEGVIKQPTYLVGEGRYNEAVVPLPNGRAIPVQMHGGQSSQQNNISVNINMDSSGNTQTQTDGADMQNLGALVATAVQKELVAQKMPGGILNKYGVA